jgi:hypothetical protein
MLSPLSECYSDGWGLLSGLHSLIKTCCLWRSQILSQRVSLFGFFPFLSVWPWNVMKELSCSPLRTCSFLSLQSFWDIILLFAYLITYFSCKPYRWEALCVLFLIIVRVPTLVLASISQLPVVSTPINFLISYRKRRNQVWFLWCCLYPPLGAGYLAKGLKSGFSDTLNPRGRHVSWVQWYHWEDPCSNFHQGNTMSRGFVTLPCFQYWHFSDSWSQAIGTGESDGSGEDGRPAWLTMPRSVWGRGESKQGSTCLLYVLTFHEESVWRRFLELKQMTSFKAKIYITLRFLFCLYCDVSSQLYNSNASATLKRVLDFI